MTKSEDCPCCSGKSFGDCCESIIERKKIAQTPLELMRSRYTAHVVKNMDHIESTMRGKSLKLWDKEKTHDEWFELCTWNKLEIIDAPEVTKTCKQGVVEFKAYYIFEGKEHVMHERSKFSKINNQWYYVLGQNKGAVNRTVEKVGRNDPCSCGSGQKYKKCCGA